MREEDRSLTKRRRIESRLGLATLARLDRMAGVRTRSSYAKFTWIIASG